MKTAMPALHEMIPDWPPFAPDSGIDLRRTDYEALKKSLIDNGATEEQIHVVLGLRKQFVMAALSASEPAALSVEAARKMIESYFFSPLGRKWVVYPLRHDRTRVVAARETGGADAVKHVSRRVPTAAALLRDAPLPERGTYLMIYGGSPEILSLADAKGRRVEDDLADLIGAVPLADVLFRHLETGQPAALYSLLAGVGERGGQSLDFPDTAVLRRLRERLSAARR